MHPDELSEVGHHIGVAMADRLKENLRTEQIVRVLKDKEDYQNIVEIKENAKGEPQVSVKVRRESLDEAITDALLGYKNTKEGLYAKKADG
jgi:transcriptional regulator of heat shock response